MNIKNAKTSSGGICPPGRSRPSVPPYISNEERASASSIVPGIYREEELDAKIPASTEDSYEMVYRLGEEEGLLVGQSSGAACWAALQVASRLDHGEVVTIFPDFGDKYLSTPFWSGWQERATKRPRP